MCRPMPPSQPEVQDRHFKHGFSVNLSSCAFGCLVDTAVFSLPGQTGVEVSPKQGCAPRLRSCLAQVCISALLVTSRMTLVCDLPSVNLIFAI